MLAQEQQILQSTFKIKYSFNADDYVRAEFEAREDELRLLRTYTNDIKRQSEIIAGQQFIIDKQLAIIEKNKQILATNASIIAELEAKLKQLQPN